MTDLSAHERAFLDAASTGDDPSDEARDRIRANLFAQLGVGAAAAGATVAAAGTAKAAAGASAKAAAGTTAKAAAATTAVAATKTSLLSKALAGLAVATMAGTAGYAATVERAGDVPVEPALIAPAENGAQAAREQAAAMADDSEQSDAAIDDDEPADGEEPDATAPAIPTAVAARPKAPSASPTAPGLSDELGLLRSAQKKLQSGDAAEALELLDDHERDHGKGNLDEERMAVRVFALCEADRKAEARAAAARFLNRYPSSPLAPRVAKACTAE